MSLQSRPKVRCPVCGGNILIFNEEKVNRCEYCGSPVLGPSQDRDCTNHSGTLATDVCHVCGDLICEECTEKRVGDYGGKLLTIVNCTKTECILASDWANPLNEEYQELANMDWADSTDNFILRIAGLGSIIMMVFELIFILGLLWIFNFSGWGFTNVPLIANSPYTGFFLALWGNFLVLVLSVLGNLLGAVLLMTALQVFIHERQLASGAAMLVILVVEATHLLFRGWFFNLHNSPFIPFVQILLTAFILGAILVLAGSIMAIYIGNKKRKQLKAAREKLGLTA